MDCFNGMICDVRYYNRKMMVADLDLLILQEVNLAQKGSLVHWWPLLRFENGGVDFEHGARDLVGVPHTYYFLFVYCFFFFENPNKKIMVDLGRFRWFFEICHFVEIFNQFSKIIHFKDISKFLSEIGQIQLNTHILMKKTNETIHFNISIWLWRIKKTSKNFLFFSNKS